MKKYILFLSAFLIVACSENPSNIKEIATVPEIYPDYVGVEIPSGIAPLNFGMASKSYNLVDVIVSANDGSCIQSQGVTTDFDIDDWHSLTQKSKGDSLKIVVRAKIKGKWLSFVPFSIYVSNDSLDAYGLTYRRIEPGYKVYKRLGIYERNLSNFEETTLFSNTELAGACVNCHTANRGSNEQFLFHVRGDLGGTVVSNNGNTEVLDAKSDKIIGSLVYPSWHPDGRFVACSSNTTRQAFHMNKDKRIEVFDQKSDIVVYDTKEHNILTSDLINKTETYFETFPSFSADGKKIYFCTEESDKSKVEVKNMQYKLCSIDFDAETQKFGNSIDTIVDMSNQNLSIALPRTSPDGRFIMFTTCDYGTFPIWHKEADLWLLRLADNQLIRLDNVNSDDTESFHNWSNNSRWFVFSSRRDDGLFTRLYIAHCDENGKCSKPFLLPQRNPKEYYSMLFDSYNTPDFATGKVNVDAKSVVSKIKNGKITID